MTINEQTAIQICKGEHTTIQGGCGKKFEVSLSDVFLIEDTFGSREGKFPAAQCPHCSSISLSYWADWRKVTKDVSSAQLNKVTAEKQFKRWRARGICDGYFNDHSRGCGCETEITNDSIYMLPDYHSRHDADCYAYTCPECGKHSKLKLTPRETPASWYPSYQEYLEGKRARL